MTLTTTLHRLLLAGFILMVSSSALVTSNALAQDFGGNLEGLVIDAQLSALPGVLITVVGEQQKQVQVSDAQGQFRYLNLNPGNYRLTAQLDGFAEVTIPNVVIQLGRTTQITITMHLKPQGG